MYDRVKTPDALPFKCASCNTQYDVKYRRPWKNNMFRCVSCVNKARVRSRQGKLELQKILAKIGNG